MENEFGAFGYKDEPRDTEYMIHLRDKMVELGATEMFFTSDTPTRYGDFGAVPGELQTANFQRGADEEFDALDVLQPGKPYMATEFWTGWVLESFNTSKYLYNLDVLTSLTTGAKAITMKDPVLQVKSNYFTICTKDQTETLEFAYELERILTRNGSVNFYMFIGGTDFSFMNGANDLPVFPYYLPDVNSYGNCNRLHVKN